MLFKLQQIQSGMLKQLGMSWFAQAQDAYQSLSGSPYLPLSSRRMQLRSKRFDRRTSSSSGGSGSHWAWRGNSSSNLLCGVLVLVPWITLVLLSVILWKAKLHGGFPPIVNEIPGGKQCVGWRQTYFCHPFA